MLFTPARGACAPAIVARQPCADHVVGQPFFLAVHHPARTAQLPAIFVARRVIPAIQCIGRSIEPVAQFGLCTLGQLALGLAGPVQLRCVIASQPDLAPTDGERVAINHALTRAFLPAQRETRAAFLPVTAAGGQLPHTPAQRPEQREGEEWRQPTPGALQPSLTLPLAIKTGGFGKLVQMVQLPGLGIGSCFCALSMDSTARTITSTSAPKMIRMPIPMIDRKMPMIERPKPSQKVRMEYS